MEEKKKKITFNKYLTLKALIILVVLLAFNSYAWFVFATKVSGGLTASVVAWDITFQVGDSETITNIEIDVSKIYPGMETYIKQISAKNSGESEATLAYEYKSLTLLGETFTVGENITREELENKIQNKYPFKISVTVDKSELTTGFEEAHFTIKVEWAYESGDDDADTYWGEKAYEFKKNHPSESCLRLGLVLSAEQKDKKI